MEDLLTEIVRSTPWIIVLFVRGFIVFVFSLGVVYILGRMLGLIESYRKKNFIAFVSMISISYAFTVVYDFDIISTPLEFYMNVAGYVLISSVFYVLIGFTLHDRFNSWVDRKFVKVPPKPKLKKKPKK